MVYSTRRFVLSLVLYYFVLVFFNPFSSAITSLGEERDNLSAFRTFVRFALVWFCLFHLPLGVWEGLRLVIVALPGLFSYLFESKCSIENTRLMGTVPLLSKLGRCTRNVLLCAQYEKKKVREKSRECHNHKPQPFPDPKRKRKPTNPNKHKSNKRTKSTKISSLFPKRGNRNTKRTEKRKNKMTHGKTYNKSPGRINHKATKSKTNTGTTALEWSVE